MKDLKAIVVGCGSIGALKPERYDRPYGENVLTHAHAYVTSPDVELCCVVDTDEKKAGEAAKKWRTDYETDLVKALAIHKPDIVSMCAPTKVHFPLLSRILEFHRPRLVIGEKPFCEDAAQAKAVRRLYADAGVPLLINYTRRYSLEYQFLQRQIAAGEWGGVYHARLLYGRGLLRDGCHGLDLFSWFFGKLEGIILNNWIHDYLPDDPSMSLFLKYSGCLDAQMIAVDSTKCRLFEMDIVTERGIIRLAEWGKWFYFYEATPDKTYGDYKSLPGTPKDAKQSDLTNGLSRLVANAAGHLLRNERLVCTVDDAVRVHEIIDAVKRVKTNIERKNASCTVQ